MVTSPLQELLETFQWEGTHQLEDFVASDLRSGYFAAGSNWGRWVIDYAMGRDDKPVCCYIHHANAQETRWPKKMCDVTWKGSIKAWVVEQCYSGGHSALRCHYQLLIGEELQFRLLLISILVGYKRLVLCMCLVEVPLFILMESFWQSLYF